MAELPPNTPTEAGPGGKAIAALILGILSLIPCCLFLAGIPAIILGRGELKMIAVGKAPKSGETLARVGSILGLIGTIIGAGIVVLWVILVALGFVVEGL